jgi:hypothetical protein
MVVQMHHLDAVANNLANVDLSGYKRDTPVDKAFPEILLRRMNDDGVYRFPLGSVDTTPIVGRLGTGVELNEVFTVFEQGPLKQTENPFDLALEGAGFLSIATEAGERYTRNGSFHLNDEGWLVTKHGEPVLGENGPLQLKKNNFVIDQDDVAVADVADDRRGLRPGIIPRAALLDERQGDSQLGGEVAPLLGEAQVHGRHHGVLDLLGDEVVAEHVKGGEHVPRNGEEALDLPGVQVDGHVAIGAGDFDHVGQQAGGDGHARLVLLVGAGVGHVGNDGGDAAG